MTTFPDTDAVFDRFPAPIAVLTVTDDQVVVERTNQAFTETFAVSAACDADAQSGNTEAESADTGTESSDSTGTSPEGDGRGRDDALSVVRRSYETAVEDGEPADGRPGGPIALTTTSGEREFRVTLLTVPEHSQTVDTDQTATDADTDQTATDADTDQTATDADQTPVEGESMVVDGGVTSAVTSRVVHLVWTPPPADLRGKDRFVELHGTTRRMLTADTREAVAEIAANAVDNVIGFPLNTVRLYEPETERLLPTAVSTATQEVMPRERPAYERGETIQWEAFDDNEFLVYQDISRIDDDVNRTGAGSMLVAPLGTHGVLTMGTEESSAITETDLELARVFAANVEAAMDRVERERVLRERERELERQNQRLDRFASVLSHDLRNPISIASGYTEVARAEAESDAVRDSLDEIQTAVERMSTLVEQTLTLAREGARVDETEPVCVPELAARLAEATTGQGPRVEFPESSDDRDDDGDGDDGDSDPGDDDGDGDDGDSDPGDDDGDSDPGRPEWTVDGDSDRVERILENLLRNATEHCGEDVTVRVGRLPDGEGFYVADDGPGIPPDRREDVFEYGTSYDEGTGLGLAIVAELTRAHGWSVEITDGWADGARFEFDTGGTAEGTDDSDDVFTSGL